VVNQTHYRLYSQNKEEINMKKNYEEFCTYVEENILSLMSDGVKRNVYIKDICKNNGVMLKGLVIMTDNTNISPTLYLESYYEEYEVGYASLDEILMEIADFYSKEEEKNYAPFDIESLQEANIIGCLVGIKNNMDFLKDIPFIPCGKDFAVIFKYYLGQSFYDSIATITITDYLAENFGYDTSRLMQLALENTPRLLPLLAEKISQVLKNLNWDDAELAKHKDVPMYVISNEIGKFGAFSLFYPETLKKLFEQFDCDMILIPSSIHECILIPYEESISFEKLNEIICTINQTQVAEDEILADRAYLLKKGTTDIFKQFIADYAYSK